MSRFCLSALLLVSAFAAACGGDGAEPATTATTAATQSPAGTPTPSERLPAPPVRKDDDPILSIAHRGEGKLLTLGEVKQLPTAEVQAGGKTYRGVTLSALAGVAGAAGDARATIEGRGADERQGGLWRGAIAQYGSTVVFVIDERGALNMVGSNVPEGQWLRVVTGVSFQ
jgi:hypothetical protein